MSLELTFFFSNTEILSELHTPFESTPPRTLTKLSGGSRSYNYLQQTLTRLSLSCRKALVLKVTTARYHHSNQNAAPPPK
jgi:hypothetical protein